MKPIALFNYGGNQLQTDPNQDQLIYEEGDESYYLSLGTSRSEAYIFSECRQQNHLRSPIYQCQSPH